jgi:hypothetical protein
VLPGRRSAGWRRRGGGEAEEDVCDAAFGGGHDGDARDLHALVRGEDWEGGQFVDGGDGVVRAATLRADRRSVSIQGNDAYTLLSIASA